MRLRRGVSMVEYAILLLVITAALITMAIYLKRAFSGRWKKAFDDTFGHGRQYEEGVTRIEKTEIN